MKTTGNDKAEWIERWKKTQPALRRFQIREIQSLSIADRQQQIANLLDLAVQFRKPRRDNGLVVLRQRLIRIFGVEADESNS